MNYYQVNTKIDSFEGADNVLQPILPSGINFACIYNQTETECGVKTEQVIVSGNSITEAQYLDFGNQ